MNDGLLICIGILACLIVGYIIGAASEEMGNHVSFSALLFVTFVCVVILLTRLAVGGG